MLDSIFIVKRNCLMPSALYRMQCNYTSVRVALMATLNAKLAHFISCCNNTKRVRQPWNKSVYM